MRVMDADNAQPGTRVASNDVGQDLLEYALLASLVAIVAMAGVQQLGDTVKRVLWDAIAAASF